MRSCFHIAFYWSPPPEPRQTLASVLVGSRGELYPQPVDGLIPDARGDLAVAVHWGQPPDGQCIEGGHPGVAGHAFSSIAEALEGFDCTYADYRRYHEWTLRHAARIKALYIISGDLVPRKRYESVAANLRSRIDIDFFEIHDYVARVQQQPSTSPQLNSERRQLRRLYHAAQSALNAGNFTDARSHATVLAEELSRNGSVVAAALVRESEDLRWTLNADAVLSAIFGEVTPAVTHGVSLNGLRMHLVDDDALSPELLAAFHAHDCDIDQDQNIEDAIETIVEDPHEVLICDAYLDATGSTLPAEKVLAAAGGDRRITRVVWSYAALDIPAELAELRLDGHDAKTVPGVSRLCSEIAELRRNRRLIR